MEINVPIREVKVYQTDDGRKIEVYNKRSEVTTEFDDKLKDQISFPQENLVFIGIAQLGFKTGPQEFKFRINGVNTVEEAFSRYKETAQAAVAELEQKMAKQQQSSQLVQASEQDLKNLDQRLKLVKPE